MLRDDRDGSAAFVIDGVYRVYAEVLGVYSLVNSDTQEEFYAPYLSVRYTSPVPTPAPTRTPTLEECFDTEILSIGDRTVEAYVVDCNRFTWDQIRHRSEEAMPKGEFSNGKIMILHGNIENCYGVRIRSWDASMNDDSAANPFSVPFAGYVLLKDGVWSSGDAYNAFYYVPGTECDVDVLFYEPTSFTSFDVLPTDFMDGKGSWTSNISMPLLFFASAEAAQAYVDSIEALY